MRQEFRISAFISWYLHLECYLECCIPTHRGAGFRIPPLPRAEFGRLALEWHNWLVTPREGAGLSNLRSAHYKRLGFLELQQSGWRMRLGRCGSGGKSSRLAVGGLPVRSHPGRVEVSLSKTPNPQLLLMSWLVPCMAANRRWCVNVCERVNERHKLYSALDKGAI